MCVCVCFYNLKQKNSVKNFVFEVVDTIFRYDLVLISLNKKIIRYIFKQKSKCFYYYKYLSF